MQSDILLLSNIYIRNTFTHFDIVVCSAYESNSTIDSRLHLFSAKLILESSNWERFALHRPLNALTFDPLHQHFHQLYQLNQSWKSRRLPCSDSAIKSPSLASPDSSNSPVLEIPLSTSTDVIDPGNFNVTNNNYNHQSRKLLNGCLTCSCRKGRSEQNSCHLFHGGMESANLWIWDPVPTIKG